MNEKINDVFTVHGISHLSPSSINTWIRNPAKWILTYLYGYKDGGGPAMWRGTVVDNAIGSYFGLHENQTKRKSLTLVQEEAMDNLLDLKRDCVKKGFEVNEDKLQKEMALVPDFIGTAVQHYSSLGEDLEGYQEKIYYEDPRLPVPIIGYVDLRHGSTIRDIKTTGVKSEGKHAHRLQVSLYARAMGCSEAVLDYIYCTKTRSEVISIPVEDIDENVEKLIKGAEAIETFLSISDNKNDLAGILIPDLDNWEWSDKDLRKEVRKIWRM
jgi:hypothetical protein